MTSREDIDGIELLELTFLKIAENPGEFLDVGETSAFIVAPKSDSKSRREAQDVIDELLAEYDLDDRFAAVECDPDGKKMSSVDVDGTFTVDPDDAEAAVGIERIQ